MAKKKVAWLVSSPTPYKIPFFERLTHLDQYQFVFYFLRWGDPQRPWSLPKEQKSQYRVLGGLELRSSLRRKSYVNFAPSILTELFKNRFDAIVIGGYNHPTMVLCIIYCILSRTPFILQSESHEKRKRSPVKMYLKNILLFPALRKCAAAFATGKAASAYWESVGVNSKDIYIVANTIDVNDLVNRSRQIEKHDEAYRIRRINENRPLGVFVGRFDRVKGLDVLMDALARLKPRQQPELVLVGNGPEESSLKEKIAKYGLPVTCLDFQPHDNLPSIYAAADFFVLPSRHEPWGVVVNEAMACGLPLLLSDQVGAIDDLLREPDNGIAFKSGCVEDLTHKLGIFAAMKPATLKKMGQASRKIIRRWGYGPSVENVGLALDGIFGDRELNS